MKSTYEARALKFARILMELFARCYTLEDYTAAISRYNHTHTRKLRYAHGVSRVVILRSDYVIKFDMEPRGSFSDGRAGNCISELAAYEMARKEGYEYLFAKPSVYTMQNHTFSIMPRINGVNDDTKNFFDYCTIAEGDWLESHICDLHEGNLGYRNGKVCVIDYAWAYDISQNEEGSTW